jgi:glycine cleavage system regulatory protein
MVESVEHSGSPRDSVVRSLAAAEKHFLISAIGPDSRGIVSRATRVLSEKQCNIESSMMSILGGHFAMMIIIGTRSPADEVTVALEDVLEAGVRITEVEQFRAQAMRDGTHEIKVVAEEDRPGVMHAVATALFDLDINIVQLSSHVNHFDPGTACGMSFRVSFPGLMPPSDVKLEIEQALNDLGVAEDAYDVVVRARETSDRPVG